MIIINHPIALPCDLIGYNEEGWDCRLFDYKVFKIKKNTRFSVSENISKPGKYEDMIFRFTAAKDMTVLYFEGKAWFHLGFTKENKVEQCTNSKSWYSS